MGKHYPSDVSDEEWAFVIGYLALCREDARQREHSLRAVFNGLRHIVRTGNQWRFMPGEPSIYKTVRVVCVEVNENAVSGQALGTVRGHRVSVIELAKVVDIKCDDACSFAVTGQWPK